MLAATVMERMLDPGMVMNIRAEIYRVKEELRAASVSGHEARGRACGGGDASTKQ